MSTCGRRCATAPAAVLLGLALLLALAARRHGALVMLLLAVLYYVSPNVRLPALKWITPGGVLALVLSILASAAFAFTMLTPGGAR